MYVVTISMKIVIFLHSFLFQYIISITFIMLDHIISITISSTEMQHCYPNFILLWQWNIVSNVILFGDWSWGPDISLGTRLSPSFPAISSGVGTGPGVCILTQLFGCFVLVTGYWSRCPDVSKFSKWLSSLMNIYKMVHCNKDHSWPTSSYLLSFKTITAIHTYIFQCVSLPSRLILNSVVYLGSKELSFFHQPWRPLQILIHIHDIVQFCLLLKSLQPFKSVNLNAFPFLRTFHKWCIVFSQKQLCTPISHTCNI